MVCFTDGNNNLSHHRRVHNSGIDGYDHILCERVGDRTLRKRNEQQKSGNGNSNSTRRRSRYNDKRHNYYLFRIDNNADGKRKQRYKSGI